MVAQFSALRPSAPVRITFLVDDSFYLAIAQSRNCKFVPQFALPLSPEFNILYPVISSFKYYGIEIQMSQDLHFFRGAYKGENIVGAIQLNYVKTPMTPIQMKVATYILSEFINENILKEGEICLPEFCICMDLKSKKYITAPTGTDIGKIRSTISKASDEFDMQWKSFE